MDADELELKRREYRLEKWKLFLSIPTPIILLILTFIVNNALQERGAFLKRQEQVLTEKQRLYGEIGKNLNVILVYINDIGDYRQYTPEDVVQKKRETDRIFWMYRPYWSDDSEKRYVAFMDAAFSTYNGSGIPARIKTSDAQKKAAYKFDSMTWDPSWDKYFDATHEDPKISDKYYDLVHYLLEDIVSTTTRKFDQ